MKSNSFVINVHKKNNTKSEVVTQLLYGDTFKKIKKIVKIGCAFSFQKINKLPTELHDEKLDLIISIAKMSAFLWHIKMQVYVPVINVGILIKLAPCLLH